MGSPREAQPVLPIVAVTHRADVSPHEIVGFILAQWDTRELDRTETFRFDTFTRFYAEEMGDELTKWIVAFDTPISPAELAQRKLATNTFEAHWMDSDGNRRVNIDAGYLARGSLVLASTKPAAHRIYLSDGIYAEITLIYESGAYTPLRWTYPDFRQPLVVNKLCEWRQRVLEFALQRC